MSFRALARNLINNSGITTASNEFEFCTIKTFFYYLCELENGPVA